MEVMIQRKNIILDATVLTTLMACARLTDFRFNLDLVPITGRGNPIEAGLILHKILEVYYKSLREGIDRVRAIDLSFNAGKDCWETGDEGDRLSCVPEDNTYADNGHIKDVGYNYIVDTLQQYFEHYKNDYWIPIDVEHVKQQIIYEDDEIRVMWKAKLDLTVDTNNGIYPTDHKSMKQRRDTNKKNNQFKGQCLLMKTRGVIINKIGFQKSLKPSEKFTRPMISYSLADLTEWSQITVPFWAKQMLAYHEIGYWPPNFTHCENKYGNCIFDRVCDADPNMREEELRLNFIRDKKWDVSND